MGFSRNVFTTTKKNPGSLGARIIYAQIRYSSITPLLAVADSAGLSPGACMRAYARAFVRACSRVNVRPLRRAALHAGRCVSAVEHGLPPAGQRSGTL